MSTAAPANAAARAGRHERGAFVRTASAGQVRRPLAKAQPRWTNYRAHLQPLLDELGEYAPE